MFANVFWIQIVKMNWLLFVFSFQFLANANFEWLIHFSLCLSMCFEFNLSKWTCCFFSQLLAYANSATFIIDWVHLTNYQMFLIVGSLDSNARKNSTQYFWPWRFWTKTNRRRMTQILFETLNAFATTVLVMVWHAQCQCMKVMFCMLFYVWILQDAIWPSICWRCSLNAVTLCEQFVQSFRWTIERRGCPWICANKATRRARKMSTRCCRRNHDCQLFPMLFWTGNASRNPFFFSPIVVFVVDRV